MEKIKHFWIAFLVSFLSLCFFSLGFAQDISYAWKTTAEDVRVWINQDSLDYDYSWDGGALEGVAHGGGILSISKDGYRISSLHQNAYYGCFPSVADSLQGKFPYKITVKNEHIIGDVDENGNMSGFAVLVSSPNEVYVGEFFNHAPNGHLTWIKNGVVNYRGNWDDGQRDGVGEECDSRGNCKTFLWNHNKRVPGLDSIRYTSSAEYIGNVSYEGIHRVPNGEGVYTNKTDTLNGYWNEGSLVGSIVHKRKDYLYEGEFYKNNYSGVGILRSGEFIYSGTFVDGFFSGVGDLFCARGDTYSGNWKLGKPWGLGNFHSAKGDSYSGNWEEGMPSGVGEYRSADGSVYSGGWKDGLRDGYGKYESAEGTYEGSWEEGWINGEGLIKYADGSYYEGDFVENKIHGRGRYKSVDGEIYEGEFTDNKPNGLGEYYKLSSGIRYEGEFFDGRFQGDGTLYIYSDSDSLAITAVWPGMGKLPSVASILFSNGDLYEGELKNGKPTENGVWTTQAERDYPEQRKAKILEEKSKDWVHRANKFYKDHEETISHIVTAVSVTLAVGSLFFPPLQTVNVVLNVVDAVVSLASSAVDLMDSIDVGGDVMDPAVALGQKVVVNVAFIAAPAVLKSKPARMTVKKLSSSARGVAKSLLNIKIGNKQPFAKMVKVVKNKAGELAKELMTSKAGIAFFRFTTKESYQFVSARNFQKIAARNTGKTLELSKEANSNVLKRNMRRCMGEDDLERLAMEKLFAPKNRGAQAHHVVPGTSNLSARSREILKKCNIDINDPRNGIFLPVSSKSIFKGSLHGSHSADYDKYVLERLETMVDKHGYSEKAAEATLDEIKMVLLKGQFLLLNNRNPNTVLSIFGE